MDNLSKLSLVKRHLEKIKSRSLKLSGFAGHLSSKYSLDTLTEKDQGRSNASQKISNTQIQVG